MRTALLIAVLFVVLAAAIFAGIYLWSSMSDVDIGLHGVVALTLGCLVSLALGGGLMFLVFYSSRHGHDEQQHRRPPE